MVRAPLAIFCFLLLSLPAFPAEENFVFWNVQNYRITPSTRTEAKPELSREAVATRIASLQPTILGLAEIADEAALVDLQQRLLALGCDLPHRALCVADPKGRHLALLSRHPLLANASRSQVPIDLNGRSRMMARGILDVTLAIPGGQLLRCIGLHWKSRLDAPGEDESVFRAAEARVSRTHLETALQSMPRPLVLVFGDLNDLKNSYPVRELAGSPGSKLALREWAPSDSRGEVWTHFWKDGGVYSRLDYLFASPALARSSCTLRISDEALPPGTSDHRPLSAIFRLP